MRIIWLGIPLVVLFFQAEGRALSGGIGEVAGNVRGRNISGQMAQVWTSMTDVRCKWVIFREGEVLQGTVAAVPGEPGLYLLECGETVPSANGEATRLARLAGWFRTHPAFLGGARAWRAEGYLFPGSPEAVLISGTRGVAGVIPLSRGVAEICPPFSGPFFAWGDRIHLR